MHVGRVIDSNGLTGKAEFTKAVRHGDYVYYKGTNNRRIICRVTTLRCTSLKGFAGEIAITEADAELPTPYAPLYLHLPPQTGHIEVGVTDRKQVVKIKVNTLFLHSLIGGMTAMGKTHLLIVLAEGFAIHKIPAFIIDVKGDLSHLNEFSPNVKVVEDLRFEDLLGYLKAHKVIVYNLQGLTTEAKIHRVHEVLNQLKMAKEIDYKRAENDERLLEIPPVLIGVDEAEIFAPEYDKDTPDPECKRILVELGERGSEYGIGLILACQRLPRLELELRSQCHSAMMFHIYDIGSKRVLREMPFIGPGDIKRITTLSVGHCLMVGQVANERPIAVHVRDIKTRRAKNVNFEEMIGLEKIAPAKDELDEADVKATELEEVANGKAAIHVMNRGAAIDVVATCPGCGKPMEWDSRQKMIICKNQNCSVIGIRHGKVLRSAARS